MQQVFHPRYLAALLCAMFALALGATCAVAQPGSAGGSIGNSEKSISGTRTMPDAGAASSPAEAPAARPRAARPPVASRRAAPSSGGKVATSKDVCERRCLHVRQVCNRAKGGFFNGCGIDAAACISRC